MPERLVDRRPVVDRGRLLADLAPPPRFAHVTVESYLPDAGQPSQAAAVAAVTAFAARLGMSPRDGARRRWRRTSPLPPEERAGLYLDGGFGVGKTHLLAALWHVAPAPKLFATFVELTHLVGALGFAEAVSVLQSYRLVCVDEFELDDPGDTVLVSTLLGRLAEAGVRIAATSNTLPDRLGEERFAAADFLREIQGLSAQFDVVRIDGQDYRHRGLPPAPDPLAEAAVEGAAVAVAGPWGAAAVDDFPALLDHLAQLHPSRYGQLLDGIAAVGWRGVAPVGDQAVALRLVVLADRLYDRDVPVVASGVSLDEVFPAELLAGGYRKKYRRALSRLVALAGEAADRTDPT